MKNKNVKVIDEHNIDRDANVMFALELEGSEYVVYWITRDDDSNNVFVSKVLRNLDGTYNMLNIDDEDKKKEIADIVKVLISSSVSDQNDKLVGNTTTLSNGKTVKFINVSFNKEQQINVTKTYITTVKKEVTKVAETYYDVTAEETKIEPVLSATPVLEPAPVVVEPITVAQPQAVAATPVTQPAPVIPEPIVVAPQPEVVVAAPVQPAPLQSVPVLEVPAATVVAPQPQVVIPTPEPAVVAPVIPQPVEVPVVPTPQPAPVIPEPVVVAPQPEVVVAASVQSTPVQSVPVLEVPTAPVVAPQPQVVTPTPEPAAVVPEVTAQPLVFNASKETNLNAALGEVANSTTIPVQNIEPVREFGVEAPVAPAVVQTSTVPVQPDATGANVAPGTPTSPKAGFANSKFFMVVAIAFFLASCVFLGYEVYNYFQLVK